MKKALLKDSIKEILNTYKRFVSILLMAFIGVGFFAGVRATSPDMKLTIDEYFDNQNMYDIRVVSTLGLTDDDINEINKIDGVEKTIGTYSEDVFVDFSDEEIVVKAFAIENSMNKVEIIQGRLPEANDECVIEENMKIGKKLNIGDIIEIREEIAEEDPTFNSSKLKIVGIVKSPLYISRDRGTTNLGTGKVSYYLYVNKENISSDIYTEIDIKIDGAQELSTLDEEYENLVSKIEDELDKIKEARQNERHQSLVLEANQKLDDAEKEFNEKKTEAEKKIADAEKEIEDSKKKIKDAEEEIKDGERKLNEEKEKANKDIASGEQQLNDAQNQIIIAQEQLDDFKIYLEAKKEEAEDGKKQLQAGINEINSTLDFLNQNKEAAEGVLDSISKIDQTLANLTVLLHQYENELESSTGDTQDLQNMILYLKAQISNLNDQRQELIEYGITTDKINEINNSIAECERQKSDLEKQINIIDSEMKKSENELLSGQAKLTASWNEVQAKKAELTEKKAEAQQKIKDAENDIIKGKKEIVDAKQELADGEKEFEENKIKFKEEIADAESKLIDARKKVDDIENAKWYILNRKNNNGFNSFSQDTDNVKRLGEVFPIVFFIIAVLISLTSMSRMVEEERVQIGTLKALGYTNLQVMSKYIIYSLMASIIGGLLGSLFGLYFFPTVIISMYKMMYDIEEIVISFNVYYVFVGIAIMSICMVGATIYTASKELKSVPAEMMRPKAPKIGKRVLIEKIPFIWNKLNFIQKVTARNMFRYKKRFMMTIIGIMGCTALILTGFGLKDSISKIMDYQYIDIYDFDMLIGLKNSLTDNEIRDAIESIEEKDEIAKCVGAYMNSGTVEKDDMKEEVQIVVTNNAQELENVIKLKDLKKGKKLELKDEGVIITEKLAELINAKIGDEIIISDSDNNEYKVIVNGITEHYISHYIYMTEGLYNSVFDDEFSINVLYAKYSDNIKLDDESELSKELLLNSKVSSVTLTSYLMSMMNDTLSAMNLVVYVLIASAGLLVFIVLYNLANVNISERIRELATIKVLGFYDKEVYDYFTREIVFLTIIGILVGLIFGYFLNMFILQTCEIGILRFKKVILPVSYVYAAIITIVFTYIVNFMTYFALKKINMIESLKSVE